MEKIGEVVYKLNLPEGSKIHPVFHVSQHKAAQGASFNPTPLPTPLSQSLDLLVEPEAVLNVRQHPTKGMESTEVLILWKGLPESEATWEPCSHIMSVFPTFHLENKVTFNGGGIVMDPAAPRPIIHHTYTRRGRR